MADSGHKKGKGPSTKSKGQAQSAKQPSKPININPNEPYRMRITSGGSISSYVDFAINFLNDNPHTPLVLHTLPTPQPNQKNTEAGPSNSTSKYSTTLLTCTTNVPRLISVAEIIKRSYIEQLRSSSDKDSKEKGKGKMRMSRGIWQYTESALYHPPIPDPETESEEVLSAEMNGLDRVLKGKLRPRMTHHPYLTITLSTIPLGLEQKSNVSVQYTLVKTKNEKKKKKKKKGNKGLQDQTDEREEQEEEMVIEVNKKVNEMNKKGLPKDESQITNYKKGVKRISDTEDQNKIGKKRKITDNSKDTASEKV
ncbi:hypothetical protein L486_00043 [Kwoniella mangroviensis CBS 10435]|uniref:Uncharacterized protein n=1 Tax=Kwoniella mangroviensis CBS 10435 TaxID=1331196 RepID=A0A1B9IY03_9TREE|nr:hypothetical protein L486_00043 [Kwoniella mangroviensis CBS 10435]